MKLAKFGILVNKTTSLSTSIFRDSSISRGCVKIVGISEGSGGGEGVKFGGQFCKIQRGGGGSYGKSLLWGWYGYFKSTCSD